MFDKVLTKDKVPAGALSYLLGKFKQLEQFCTLIEPNNIIVEGNALTANFSELIIECNTTGVAIGCKYLKTFSKDVIKSKSKEFSEFTFYFDYLKTTHNNDKLIVLPKMQIGLQVVKNFELKRYYKTHKVELQVFNSEKDVFTLRGFLSEYATKNNVVVFCKIKDKEKETISSDNRAGRWVNSSKGGALRPKK